VVVIYPVDLSVSIHGKISDTPLQPGCSAVVRYLVYPSPETTFMGQKALARENSIRIQRKSYQNSVLSSAVGRLNTPATETRSRPVVVCETTKISRLDWCGLLVDAVDI